MNKNILLIIPTYNEQHNIELITKKIVQEFQISKIYDYKICFVDDGSKDQTENILKNLKRKNKKIDYISLGKNFGKDIAISAGFKENDTYNYTIVIDADLQHPVEKINYLLKNIKKNHVMIGVRNENYNFIKNFFSTIFYKMINIFSKNNFIKNSTDFSIVSKKTANIIKKNTSRIYAYRFYLTTINQNPKIFYFNVKNRVKGKSKFNFFQLLKLSIYSFISYTSFPTMILSFIFPFLLLFIFLILTLQISLLLKFLALIFILSQFLILLTLSLLFLYIRKLDDNNYLYFLKN